MRLLTIEKALFFSQRVALKTEQTKLTNLASSCDYILLYERTNVLLSSILLTRTQERREEKDRVGLT